MLHFLRIACERDLALFEVPVQLLGLWSEVLNYST